jgi:hypothetical protein
MNQLDETFYTHAKSPMRTGRAQAGQLTTGRQQSVAAQATFGVASNFTVTVDVQADTTVAFASAIVAWSIDGTTITRQFDVSAGATISGLAEAVQVRVSDSTPTGHPQGIVYGVVIAIAAESRPTTAVPPVLTGLASVAVGAAASTVAIPVPAGANGVVVYGSTAAGAPTLQLAEQTADGSVTVLETSVAPGQFVPLVSGAGRVVVTNLGGATANVTVVFSIDG